MINLDIKILIFKIVRKTSNSIFNNSKIFLIYNKNNPIQEYSKYIKFIRKLIGCY